MASFPEFTSISVQEKQNIINIFNENGLYEITIDDFDIDKYDREFIQKLYKFFTYGYIIIDHVQTKFNNMRSSIENYNKTNNITFKSVNEENQSIEKQIIEHYIGTIKKNNDDFLKELFSKNLILVNEMNFLKSEKFIKYIYEPNFHITKFSLLLKNFEELNFKEKDDPDWKTYDNIIKCVIYRLYLAMKPTTERENDDSMEITDENQYNAETELTKLVRDVRDHIEGKPKGGRSKKTIKKN